MKMPFRKISDDGWSILLLIELLVVCFILGTMEKTSNMGVYGFSYTLLMTTIAMVMERRRKLILIVVIALNINYWLGKLTDHWWLIDISSFFYILFFIYTVILFIGEIARSKNVDRTVIFHAINGYLLLGLSLAILAYILNQYNPSSVSFQGEVDGFADYMYFILVTMSTLGYGDVLPSSPVSKALASFTAVCGQMYVAIIIALIVGKYAGKK